MVEEIAGDQALGVRMKCHEETTRRFLPRDVPFVVRLDGRKFSNFTAGLQRPFDSRFANAMALVAADMLEEFTPRTVYTQSDEISLLFYPNIELSSFQYIFNGRVDKIVSVMAAYATARLITHLRNENWSTYSASVQARMLSGKVSFDGRAFPLDETEMCNHLVWRCRHDCVRNTISNYAFHHFGARQVHGLSGVQMRLKLQQEANIDWDRDVPDRARFGLFLKKAQVAVQTPIPNGPQAGQMVNSMRTRVVTRSFLLDRATPEFVALLKARYVNDW